MLKRLLLMRTSTDSDIDLGNNLKLKDFQESKAAEAAQKHVKWSLMGNNVIDCDSAIAITHNYLLLPHICVIVRTVTYICTQKYGSRFSYVYRLDDGDLAAWASLFIDLAKVIAVLLLCRYVILHLQMKGMRNSLI